MLAKSLAFLVLKHLLCEDDQWYLAAETVLDMVFSVQDRPEQVAQHLLQKASQHLLSSGPAFQHLLARLAFLVGHLSLKVLLLVDGLEHSLRKMKSEKEKDQIAEEHNELTQMDGGLEAEVDARIDTLHDILDKDIIQHNLIGQFSQAIGRVCQDLLQGRRGKGSGVLEKVCVTALAKMMCVSKSFCA